MDELSYCRHRFPAVVIQNAVWLYCRFTLSYRDVEDLLAERGLDVSYETVRRWVLKFGQIYARQIQRERPRPTGRWLSLPKTLSTAPDSGYLSLKAGVCPDQQLFRLFAARLNPDNATPTRCATIGPPPPAPARNHRGQRKCRRHRRFRGAAGEPTPLSYPDRSPPPAQPPPNHRHSDIHESFGLNRIPVRRGPFLSFTTAQCGLGRPGQGH